MKSFKLIALLLGSNIGAGHEIKTDVKNQHPTLNDVKAADISVNIFVDSDVETLNINRWIKFYPESTLNIWVNDGFIASRDNNMSLFTVPQEKLNDGQINILKLEDINKILEDIFGSVINLHKTNISQIMKNRLKYITTISDQLFKEKKCKKALFFNSYVFPTDSIDKISKYLNKYGFAYGVDQGNTCQEENALIVKGSRFIDAMKVFLNSDVSKKINHVSFLKSAFIDISVYLSNKWYSRSLHHVIQNGIKVNITTESKLVSCDHMLEAISHDDRGDGLFCQVDEKEISFSDYRNHVYNLYLKGSEMIPGLKIELPLFKCENTLYSKTVNSD